jgi:O-antigen ligase
MTFSGFLLICDLLLFASLLFGWRRLRRRGAWALIWRLGALLTVNAALLGSLTRSAWLGVAVGGLLLVALRARRALAAVPVAAVVFVLLAPVPLLHRVLSTADLSDPSNYDRLAMAEAGGRMIAERPWTGQGPDLVVERYPIYRPPSAVRYWVPHLHDNLLQLGAERGLPAVAAFLLLAAVPLVAAWRLYRREGRLAGPRADLLLGAVAALVAFHVAGLFEYNWGDTEVQRLALFVMALPFCLGPPAADAPPPPAILAP